ncbi:MAG TPA: HNH endonuclease signature motif containing protein [Pseudomonadales bacterium]|nr:HNH endonuclease signature motif containing protein [Pseudomonadales bacterium]
MPYLPINIKKRDGTQGYDQTNKSFYTSKPWRDLRAYILRTTPLCAVCLSGNIMNDCTRGGHVDHIIRIRAGGAKLDIKNLWVLCKHHHDRKSYLESRGYEVDKKIADGEYVPTPDGLKDLISKIV